ncbi:MAG: GNAT family N-acetyltransferase [Promethearchaeota archaeon]|nr:MAG: GNAT family N-acetyltransferase [Candidatus Lokiarchaeota archaeon]
MNIRPYHPSDYSQVYQLWELGHLSLGSSDTFTNIERFAQMNPSFFLVGEVDDQLMAVVMGAFDGRRGYVHHLSVHPDPKYRRHGYATMLMQELHHRFQNHGVEKVHLFVERTNSAVMAFYTHLGWFLRTDLQMMSYIPDSDPSHTSKS